ncbi:hypothetical protein GCM10008949_50270 [Deinococcus humi]|nr:hypothetical protein GCM10008949_50270 [Deinococcus humi]
MELLLTQHTLDFGLTDPCARCAVPLKHADINQVVNGAPDSHTADPELLCQFTFRRNPVSRNKLGALQHGLYPLLDLYVTG